MINLNTPKKYRKHIKCKNTRNLQSSIHYNTWLMSFILLVAFIKIIFHSLPTSDDKFEQNNLSPKHPLINLSQPYLKPHTHNKFPITILTQH